jgi:hypothetical protein
MPSSMQRRTPLEKGAIDELFSWTFPYMRDLPFPYVTILSDTPGQVRNVRSVAEAAELLVLYWPTRVGEKLLEARQACQDALDGEITCTQARQAFIDAAKEAGIYVGQEYL